MAEIEYTGTIDFEVCCDCGAALETEVTTDWKGDLILSVDACEVCLEAHGDERYGEGLDEGRQDGGVTNG